MDRQRHQLGHRRRRHVVDAARRRPSDQPIACPYSRPRHELRTRNHDLQSRPGGHGRQDVPDWVYAELKQASIDFVFKQCKSRQDLAETGGDANVIWVFGDHESVYKENLDVLKRSGAIIRTGSGTDNIPVAEATKLGIIVANTPLAAAHTVADHAIALLFAVTRQIVAQDRQVRQGKWDRYLAWPNYHLHGQTLGLVGFGHIAKLVTRKMSGFDMQVISHDPVVRPAAMAALGVEAVGFEDLLKRSDFISVHCPLLPTTRHLISERALCA
jgi:phosphoglycerate dehydrogenase-like enzyme